MSYKIFCNYNDSIYLIYIILVFNTSSLHQSNNRALILLVDIDVCLKNKHTFQNDSVRKNDVSDEEKCKL